MRNLYSFEDKLNECLREERLPFTQSGDEAKAKVMQRVNHQLTNERRFSFGFLRVAATTGLVVLGLALIWLLIGRTTVTSEELAGKPIELPDGSTAFLNSTSTLKFNAATWPFNRKVELLSGEAFFNVEKGSRFKVETSVGEVSVLGTSFNVRLSDNKLIVACKTGSVEVHCGRTNQKIILSPGELVEAGVPGAEVKSVSPLHIAEWIKGEFFFDNIPVRDVFSVLAGQTGYTIDVDPDVQANYTGQFNKTQKLTEILDIVCLPLDLKYSVDTENKNIQITKN